MDPITQGALGAALPQSVSNRLLFATASVTERKAKLKTITWLACLAGMAPDIDVLIRSSTDPLLFLVYHRQFTHSLIFIPFGALICTLLFYRWSRSNLTLKQSFLTCLLAYSTHALLDACTTYGTQLFWPFTDVRIAWNNVSVFDPTVTLPLLALVIATYRSGKPLFARLGLAWIIGYLALGVVQNERAESYGYEVAKSRGHEPVNLSAKPGFANLLLWKVIYEYDGQYYVDAIRVGVSAKVYAGSSVARLNLNRDFPWLKPGSQQAIDVSRFAWFSSNYLALDEDDPNVIIDMRYSLIPNEIDALWAIKLDPEAGDGQHVQYQAQRDPSPERMSKLVDMLFGR